MGEPKVTRIKVAVFDTENGTRSVPEPDEDEMEKADSVTIRRKVEPVS